MSSSGGPVGASVSGAGVGVGPAGGGPDNAIARWHGTTQIQGSGVLLTDDDRVRGPHDFVVQGRNELNTAWINMLGLHPADDNLWLGSTHHGASRPTDIHVSANNTVQVRTDGTLRWYAHANGIRYYVPLVEFFSAIGNVTIGHQANAADGATGWLFTTAAQDVTSLAAAVTQGGLRFDRAGDAPGPAGVGGDYMNRAGAGGSGVGGAYAIADGPGNVNVQIDDTGTHNRRAWSVRSVQVALAGSPYAITADDIVIACQSLTGLITINLPPAAAWLDRLLCVKDDDSNAAINGITILPVAGDTIDNLPAPDLLRANDDCRCYQSDGVNNWRRIGTYP